MASQTTPARPAITLTPAEHRRKRVSQIAIEIVDSRVAAGEIDPDDEQAMNAACREAVLDAKAIYDAAIEYLS